MTALTPPAPPSLVATAPGRPAGVVHALGNILWLLLAGIWMACTYVVVGLFLCLTIIGIPFGIASFKLAGLAVVPFGKQVVNAGTPLPPGTRVYLAV